MSTDNPTITRIVFQRHEPESGDVLHGRGYRHALAVGRKLHEMGFAPDAIGCSNRLRCVSTQAATLTGVRDADPSYVIPKFNGDDCLGEGMDGDHIFSDDEVRELLQASADQPELSREHFLLKGLVAADKMGLRGLEGADFVMELVIANPGKIILVTSHGGNRLEHMIAELMDSTVEELSHIFKEGDVCVMTFVDRKQDSFEFLGDIA